MVRHSTRYDDVIFSMTDVILFTSRREGGHSHRLYSHNCNCSQSIYSQQSKCAQKCNQRQEMDGHVHTKSKSKILQLFIWELKWRMDTVFQLQRWTWIEWSNFQESPSTIDGRAVKGQRLKTSQTVKQLVTCMVQINILPTDAVVTTEAMGVHDQSQM